MTFNTSSIIIKSRDAAAGAVLPEEPVKNTLRVCLGIRKPLPTLTQPLELLVSNVFLLHYQLSPQQSGGKV